MSIYVKATLEFRLEVEVERTSRGSIRVWATEVDSDGGLYHTPNDLDGRELMYDFSANEVAGMSDQEIADKAARLVE